MEQVSNDDNDLSSLVPQSDSERRRSVLALLRILNSSGKSGR
jgi:hypothetical protein